MAKVSLATTAKAFMERVRTPDHLLGFVQRRRLRHIDVFMFFGSAFSLRNICTGDGFKHDGFRHETKEEEHPVEVLVLELLLSHFSELCMSRCSAWLNYFHVAPLIPWSTLLYHALEVGKGGGGGGGDRYGRGSRHQLAFSMTSRIFEITSTLASVRRAVLSLVDLF